MRCLVLLAAAMVTMQPVASSLLRSLGVSRERERSSVQEAAAGQSPQENEAHQLYQMIAAGARQRPTMAVQKSENTSARDGEHPISADGSPEIAVEKSYLPEMDPDKQEYERVMGDLWQFQQQLKHTRDKAEYHYKTMAGVEKYLSGRFVPDSVKLESQIRAEAGEAAKAEAKVLAERLARMHYDEVATLDRSTRFWQDKLAKEKELTKIAEAKATLEEAAMNMTALQAVIDARNIDHVRRVEKDRVGLWLRNFNVDLAARDGQAMQAMLDERDRIRFDPNVNVFEEAAKDSAMRRAFESYSNPQVPPTDQVKDARVEQVLQAYNNPFASPTH